MGQALSAIAAGLIGHIWSVDEILTTVVVHNT